MTDTAATSSLIDKRELITSVVAAVISAAIIALLHKAKVL